MSDRIKWCFAHSHVKCLSNHPAHSLIEHCLMMCHEDEEQHECDIWEAVINALTKENNDD